MMIRRELLGKKNAPSPPTLIPEGNVDYGADTVYDYFLEYSDFSKEKYDESGKILAVYDKYSDSAFLTYTYDGNGRLSSITYMGSKTMYLEYQSNRLDYIKYDKHKIRFFYSTEGKLSYVESYINDNEIERSTGLKYTFTITKLNFDLVDVDFNYKVEAVENDTTVLYSKELKVADDIKILEIIDKNGDNIVNKVSYRVPTDFIYDKPPFYYVDVIDNNGVEIRFQLGGKEVLYSYEVKDGNPQFYSNDSLFFGNVTLYNEIGVSNSVKTNGIQTKNDGIPMTFDNNVWSLVVTGNNGGVGYYALSGWIKSKSSSVSDFTIRVVTSEADLIQDLNVYPESTEQWSYFSEIILAPPCTLQISPLEDTFSMRDLKITYLESRISENGEISHVNIHEYILFDGNNEIYLQDASFYYSVNEHNYEIVGEEGEEAYVTLSDIMRYKLRKKRNGTCNEVYYNNCKNVLAGPTDLKVFYNNSFRSISEFDLGVITHSKGKKSLTRITVDENNQNSDIVKRYYIEDIEVTVEKLNTNLDVKEITKDNVTVYYEYVSTSCGLISKQTSAPVGFNKDDVSNPNIIVKEFNYNGELTKLESIEDEFGNVIEYTTDDVWGVVTATTVKDATGTVLSVISDTFDENEGVLTQRAFDIAGDTNSSRQNLFEFSNNAISSITHGALC